ncbi:hypothetical protein BsWGS_00625 [Bradybaena similaris]
MSFSLLKYVGDRGLGRSSYFGMKDSMYSSLYSTMAPIQVTETTPCDGLDWGAVFGFGFSPDGSLLAAACENRCMLLYDPKNARLIQRRFKTHTDCVNCVRFLDNRTFATCSDDSTVRLWDARFLSSEIRVLKGHTSWVKNIEYSSCEGKLITSGFDGNIFAWDINNYSDTEYAEPLFYINGMMRTKITPNENKMIVSTLGGYFLLIHDLELDSLKADMAGFKPHLYRLMQLINTPFHHALQYNHMFTRKRNRVEFMCDFPDDDNAESISTMQVHPQGWCIASRNTTLDEESEWTCIHDIQPMENGNKLDAFKERDSVPDNTMSKHSPRNSIDVEPQVSSQSASRETNGALSQSSQLPSNSLPEYPVLWGLEGIRSRFLNEAADDDSGSSSDESDFSSSEYDNAESRDTVSSEIRSPYNRYVSFSSDTSNEELSLPVSDHSPERGNEYSLINTSLLGREINEALSNSQGAAVAPLSASDRLSPSFSADQHNYRASQIQASDSNNIHHDERGDRINDDHTPRGLIFYEALTVSRGGRVRHQMAVRHADNVSSQPASLRIKNVKSRLLFYSEEPNVGRGFIKEQSFSSDGRVIASPFGNCVRLLAFNSHCSELCDCVPLKPKALTQVGLTVNQKSSILASTFSPNHCTFVAGARDGSISFCSPKL